MGDSKLKIMDLFKNISSEKRKSFRIVIFCILLIIGISLVYGVTSLSNNSIRSKCKTMYENKTPYVGSSYNVSAIVNNLFNHEDIKFHKLELHSDEKPYGITVSYISEEFDFDFDFNGFNLYHQFHRNAIILFSLIDNVDKINFIISAENDIRTRMLPIELYYTRQNADEIIGVDVREYNRDFASFKQLTKELETLQFKSIYQTKWLDLYVWINPDVTGNDDEYYTLLPGNEDSQPPNQVYNMDVATDDIYIINDMLAKCSDDTFVSVNLYYSPNEHQESDEEVEEPIDMQSVIDSIKFPMNRNTSDKDKIKHAYPSIFDLPYVLCIEIINDLPDDN